MSTKYSNQRERRKNAPNSHSWCYYHQTFCHVTTTLSEWYIRPISHCLKLKLTKRDCGLTTLFNYEVEDKLERLHCSSERTTVF